MCGCYRAVTRRRIAGYVVGLRPAQRLRWSWSCGSRRVTGAVLKIARFERATRLGPVIYIAMGWSGAALVPSMWQRGGLIPVVCFVMGGIAYTVGAVCFAHRWPRLVPERFSYHEGLARNSRSLPPDCTSRRSRRSPPESPREIKSTVNATPPDIRASDDWSVNSEPSLGIGGWASAPRDATTNTATQPQSESGPYRAPDNAPRRSCS